MWVKYSGALSENLFQLLTSVSSHLLAVDRESALIDAGISATAGQLQSEIERVLGQGVMLDYLLLTHAHFDHLGGLPALRKSFPALKLVCGQQTAAMLERSEVLESCYQKNLLCAGAVKSELGMSREEWISLLRPDKVMNHGDVLSLGGELEIRMLNAAGHTEDSVVYLIKPDSVLAAGEALGAYGGRDKIAFACHAGFPAFISSLERLAGVGAMMISFAHTGSLSGQMAVRYLAQAKQAAGSLAQSIKQRAASGERESDIVESIKTEWHVSNLCPEGPFVEEQLESAKAIVAACLAA